MVFSVCGPLVSSVVLLALTDVPWVIGVERIFTRIAMPWGYERVISSYRMMSVRLFSEFIGDIKMTEPSKVKPTRTSAEDPGIRLSSWIGKTHADRMKIQNRRGMS